MTALCRRLTRAIVQYDIAIFALLNRHKPATLALVLHALEPVTALHEQLAAGWVQAC